MHHISPSKALVSAFIFCSRASFTSLLYYKNLSSALSRYYSSSTLLSRFLFPVYENNSSYHKSSLSGHASANYCYSEENEEYGVVPDLNTELS